MRIQRTTCLGLLLLTTMAGGAHARGRRSAAKPPATKPSEAKPQEPSVPKPPAPLQPDPSLEPEPPPAPLQLEEEEPPPSRIPAESEKPAPTLTPSKPRDLPAPERTARRLSAAAWTGTAVTLGLITAGTVVGVLAQRRSDDLSRSTVQPEGGLPPIYDAAQHDAYTTLQREGRALDRATIACFLVAGITAATSGVLFWDAAAIRTAQKKLALRLSIQPELAAGVGRAASPLVLQGGLLSLTGRF